LLRTPGHTPGHSSLLVKLAQTGSVIITGDAVHFRENYDTDGVPAFNFDRAETVASIERLKKIAANLKATVIIRIVAFALIVLCENRASRAAVRQKRRRP
jgi:glyoxylase-like metal-dependent hydrolase (beta-lactamase superfamily II)